MGRGGPFDAQRKPAGAGKQVKLLFLHHKTRILLKILWCFVLQYYVKLPCTSTTYRLQSQRGMPCSRTSAAIAAWFRVHTWRKATSLNSWLK